MTALASESMTEDAGASIQTKAFCVGLRWRHLIQCDCRFLTLFEQLEHIRDEERIIAVMKGLLNDYSDDELRDMAAFYAEQTTKVSRADDTNLALGQKIYRAGNVESGVPACTGCHGPAGKGLESAQYPMLGGQKAEYVVTSLIAYQTGERAIDEHGKIMQGIASRLTVEEIRAVANYVSGLY